MLEEIIKNIPLNIFVVNTDGIIEYANIDCCGCSASVIKGSILDNIISSQYVCRDLERWVRYSCETKQKVNLYVKLRDESFKEKRYRVYISPLDAEKAVTTWIDLDEYNLNDSIIDIDKKEEESFKAKIESINILSHEIRTPLTSILNMIEFLYLKVKDNSFVECLEIIKNSAERLKSLLLNIIDFTYDSFSSPSSIVGFSLNQLGEEIIQRHRESTAKFNTILSVKCNVEKTLLLSGNEIYLWRIVNTILSSTTKHIKDGKIEIEINPICIKSKKITVGFKIKIDGKGNFKHYLRKIKESTSLSLDKNNNIYFGDITYSFFLLNIFLSEMRGKIELYEGEPFVVSLEIPFEIVSSL